VKWEWVSLKSFVCFGHAEDHAWQQSGTLCDEEDHQDDRGMGHDVCPPYCFATMRAPTGERQQKSLAN
jgi:hypothetical protein